jgi:hypothetical protein
VTIFVVDQPMAAVFHVQMIIVLVAALGFVPTMTHVVGAELDVVRLVLNAVQRNAVRR